MFTFKVTALDDGTCTGKAELLAVNCSLTHLDFLPPNSNIRATHELKPGTMYNIDSLALVNPLTIGNTYQLTGSWMNFTKRTPPDFIFCLTGAILIPEA